MFIDPGLDIKPEHVFITLISFAIIVVGFLWKITSAIWNMSSTVTRIEMKTDTLWENFTKTLKSQDKRYK